MQKIKNGVDMSTASKYIKTIQNEFKREKTKIIIIKNYIQTD